MGSRQSGKGMESHRTGRTQMCRGSMVMIKYLKYILYLVCAVCAACVIVFFIRHYTNSKYNVIPRKAVRQYLDETYNMNYEFIEENFRFEKGYYIWEFICQDDEGYRFTLAYYYDKEEEGPVTEDKVHITHIKDAFLTAKLKDEFQDAVKWKKVPYMDRDFLIFEIYDESDLEQAAEIMTDIFDFSLAYIQRVYEKHSPVHCSIYYMDSYKGVISLDSEIYSYKDEERDELYRFVYSKLEKMTDKDK